MKSKGLTPELQKAMEKIIAQIAVQHGVTEEEVRRDITEVIVTAMADPDPMVRAEWELCPRAGEVPTPEEFIFWASGKTIRSMDPEPYAPGNTAYPTRYK